VARYPACLRENGQYVFERLFELRNELLALEMLIGIPPNLTSNKHNAARHHTDAVG